MKRSDFFKSFVGLIGVATNVNELALFDTPIIIKLSSYTRIGDLIVDKSMKIFYFDGKRLRSVDGSTKDINCIIGDSENYNYRTLSRAIGER